MGGNHSINEVNEDNLMIASQEQRTNYLYNFMPKHEVNKMSYNKKYFYSVKNWLNLYIEKYKNKIILDNKVSAYYFATTLDEFKRKIISTKEDMNEDIWENIRQSIQLSEKEIFRLQDFLNSTSNYEKFLFQLSVIIQNRMIDKQPKKVVFVTKENKNIIPLIGLHSTTNESYEKIIKEGFNSSKGNIYGKTKDKEWPVAMFTNPFLGLTEIYSSLQFCGRDWRLQIITLTNGITRMLRANESSFPIIISMFKNTNNLKHTGYIESFDAKNILIIGKIDVKFSDKTLKYMRTEFEKEGEFDCSKHPKLPLDYTVTWF